MPIGTGNFSEAEAALRKSTAISTRFGANHYILSRILSAQGQVEPDSKDAGLAMVYHALLRKMNSPEKRRGDASSMPFCFPIAAGRDRSRVDLRPRGANRPGNNL